MELASSVISRGMVAEKNSVWRLAGTLRDDAPDVVDEAHVEHAVGFVEHEDLDAVERHGAVLHQVEQPSGRCDQHVDAMRERADLRVDVHAADRERHRRAQIAAVGLEAVDDLRRKLARRGEHQHAAALRQRLVAVVGEVIEDRQREGGGLAGSGLRDADDVAALHHLRDGLRLDRRGGGVLFVSEGLGDRLGEAEIEKSSQLQIFRVAISAAAADVGFTRYRQRTSRPPSRRLLDIPRVWAVDERVGCEGSKTKTWNSFTRPISGR